MTSKQGNPRSAPNEMIVTRHKSAQFKRQLRNKDRSMKRITQLLKSPSNKRNQTPIKTYRPAKKTPPKKPKKEEKEPKTPVKTHPIVKIDRLIMKSPQKKETIVDEKEYYPNKMKRKSIAKKILLKPPNQMTLIGDTNTLNKRKRHIPVKDLKSCKIDGRDYELSKKDSNQSLSPELSLQEVLPMDEYQDMTDEDLMEILTCPSPVWWEDPLDSEYEEDPIDVKEIFAKKSLFNEKNIVKNKFLNTPKKKGNSNSGLIIQQQSKSVRTKTNAVQIDVKKIGYDSDNNNLKLKTIINIDKSKYTSQLHVETDRNPVIQNVQIDNILKLATKFSENFLSKRNKLENVLGCVKNRILTNKTDNINVTKRNATLSYSKKNIIKVSTTNERKCPDNQKSDFHNALSANNSGNEPATNVRASTEYTSKYKPTNISYKTKSSKEDKSLKTTKYLNMDISDSCHSKNMKITEHNADKTKKNITIIQKQDNVQISKVMDHSNFLNNYNINDDSKLNQSLVENIRFQASTENKTNTSINEASNTHSAVNSCLKNKKDSKSQIKLSNFLRNEKKNPKLVAVSTILGDFFSVDKYDKKFLMKRKRLESISGFVKNRIEAKMSKLKRCDSTKDNKNIESNVSKVQIVRNKRKNMYPKAVEILVDQNEDLINKLVNGRKIIENTSCTLNEKQKNNCTHNFVDAKTLSQYNHCNRPPIMIAKDSNLNIDNANISKESCRDTQNQPKKGEELLKGGSPGKHCRERENSESTDGEDFFCDDEMLMHLENLDIRIEDANANKKNAADFINDQNCSNAKSRIVSDLRPNHLHLENEGTQINVENFKIQLIENKEEKCSSPLLKENSTLDRLTNTGAHVPKILPKLQKNPQKNGEMKLVSPVPLGRLCVFDSAYSSNDASGKDMLDTISDTNIRFVMDEEVDNTDTYIDKTIKEPKDKIQPPINIHLQKEGIINCLTPALSKSFNNQDSMTQKAGKKSENYPKFLENKALVETLEEKNPLDDLEYITVYKITANPNYDDNADKELPIIKLKDIKTILKENEKKPSDLPNKTGINDKQETVTPLTSTSEITKKRKIVCRKPRTKTDSKKAKTSDNAASSVSKNVVKIIIHPDDEKSIINKTKRNRKLRKPGIRKGQERIVVSEDTTVKYCMKCSSIFDTDSCTYCCRKQNLTNKLDSLKTNKLISPFGTCSLNYGENGHETNVFVCEVCAFCTPSNDLIVNHVCQTSSNDLRQNLTNY